MSAPNDEGNPWISLADLLQKKITVAILATVIETSGIQTYDRFGRRILATDDNAESKVSKARALDLLASYYTEKLEAEEGPPHTIRNSILIVGLNITAHFTNSAGRQTRRLILVRFLLRLCRIL